MGWEWVEDEEDSGSPEAEGWRSTRRVVRSSCWTEEVVPGRFIRKCEKTEQLLRDCVGRPSEIVESKPVGGGWSFWLAGGWFE